MILKYKDLDPSRRYKVMSGSVIPRPIAWIVTEDEGVVNIAPFSYFTPLSSNPATVVVSIGHKKDSTPKDTLANIYKHKKATICFVKEAHLEKMKLSAQPLEKNISEADCYDIDMHKVLCDYPPIVKDTHSAMFCDFYSKVELPGKTIPVILEIKKQYFLDEKIDNDLNVFLENVSRVGKEFALNKKI